MTPALRLAVSLVVSLLLWLPTIPAALNNAEDPARIAIRYLLSLLVARIGVGLVFRIVGAYVPDEVEEEQELPVAEQAPREDAFGRRRDDFDAPRGMTEEELLDDALNDVADQTALVQ